MKRFSVILSCLFVFVFTISSFAQDPESNVQRDGRRQKAGRSLKRMDANNDGKISRDEWGKSPEAFNQLDKNNDGILTSDEAADAGRANVKRALRQMDANDDGQVTRDEWKRDPESFNRIDANNDGVITRDELKSRKSSGRRPPQ